LRAAVFAAALAASLPLLFLASLSTGPYEDAGLREALAFLVGDRSTLTPIIEYRLRRTMAAILLGAGLAASGQAMQYALRNPLADPYLLGASAGAALGVVLAYYIHGAPSPYAIYAYAIIGATAAFAAVVALAWREGASPTSLVVAGVSVSYALVGAAIIVMYKGMVVQQAFLWLFGTVAYTPDPMLYWTAALTVAGAAFLAAVSRRAYTLVLGDEVAESMGVKVGSLRLSMLVAASTIVAAVVALAGPVGFIGLAAPWIARLALGAEYARVMAASAATGAALALASDIAVRIIGGSTELPLAAVTALFGGPILFHLARRTGW